MDMTLLPNEHILHQGFAYHFPEMIGFTGHLVLTNQRLYFETHPLNFKRYAFLVRLSDVADVVLQNRLVIFPNGMNIRLHQGSTHRFAVWNRRKWKRLIEQALSQSAL